jgi:hypothetical protein
MTQRTKVTDWVKVTANVNPDTLALMDAERERTGLSRAAIVRNALERAYGQNRVPEPWPQGTNLRPPSRSPGFLP